MAVQIRSDYPTGISRTRVSGLPRSPDVPAMGNRDPEAYLREILRREDLALARARPRAAPAARVPVAAASRAMDRPRPKRGSASVRRAEQEAAYNAAMNRTLAAKSARSPAPMRVVHGAGMTPGRIMDPNAMSAIQRQMFLPGSAGFAAPKSAGLGPSAARIEQTPDELHALRMAAARKGTISEEDKKKLANKGHQGTG